MLDTVLPPGQAPERSTRIATHLVRFAIDELAQIERLDENLAPEDPLQFDRPTVAWVRGMYERWADEAESLLVRVDEVERQSGPIAGAATLRDAHGRTRAMLAVSLDELEKGARDIAEGRTVPLWRRSGVSYAYAFGEEASACTHAMRRTLTDSTSRIRLRRALI